MIRSHKSVFATSQLDVGKFKGLLGQIKIDKPIIPEKHRHISPDKILVLFSIKIIYAIGALLWYFPNLIFSAGQPVEPVDDIQYTPHRFPCPCHSLHTSAVPCIPKSLKQLIIKLWSTAHRIIYLYFGHF